MFIKKLFERIVQTVLGIINRKQKKYLYASPVGKDGKNYLTKIINEFGHDDFDYIIFTFDGVSLEEEIFDKCTVISEKGRRWYFMKKYVTPALVNQYKYVFIWPDDIDIENFSYSNFINVIKRNRLQVVQPALTEQSYCSHPLLFKKNDVPVGRLVDFVEIMVPVFTAKSWRVFWKYINYEKNPCGWGMDELMCSLCGFSKVGVVDSEAVTHTRKVTYGKRELDGQQWFREKYIDYPVAKKMTIGQLN